jgi:hypothetical protein
VPGERPDFHSIDKFEKIDIKSVVDTSGEMSDVWKEAVERPAPVQE